MIEYAENIPLRAGRQPFEAIHHKWAMITTQSGEKVNTMVASWGGVGIMWNRPVTWVFLRPQRFTRELLDRSERFSVCFLPEQYHQQMNYCGSHSGRVLYFYIYKGNRSNEFIAP